MLLPPGIFYRVTSICTTMNGSTRNNIPGITKGTQYAYSYLLYHVQVYVHKERRHCDSACLNTKNTAAEYIQRQVNNMLFSSSGKKVHVNHLMKASLSWCYVVVNVSLQAPRNEKWAWVRLYISGSPFMTCYRRSAGFKLPVRPLPDWMWIA
jgi:hypothetical protein